MVHRNSVEHEANLPSLIFKHDRELWKSCACGLWDWYRRLLKSFEQYRQQACDFDCCNTTTQEARACGKCYAPAKNNLLLSRQTECYCRDDFFCRFSSWNSQRVQAIERNKNQNFEYQGINASEMDPSKVIVLICLAPSSINLFYYRNAQDWYLCKDVCCSRVPK